MNVNKLKYWLMQFRAIIFTCSLAFFGIILFLLILTIPDMLNVEFALNRMYWNFLSDIMGIIFSLVAILGVVLSIIDIIKHLRHKSEEKINIPITMISIICVCIIAFLSFVPSVRNVYDMAIDYKVQDTKMVQLDNIKTEKRSHGKGSRYYLMGILHDSKEEKEFIINYPISEEIDSLKLNGTSSIKVEYYWRSNTFRNYIPIY